MLGSDILVAPIMNYKERGREVYLPSGEKWRHLFTGKEYAGERLIMSQHLLNKSRYLLKNPPLNFLNR
ncbi:hypothetical protein LOS23_03825 [Enterococcus faecium]|nr:hypothetical protein [Enterococcus faecium]